MSAEDAPHVDLDPDRTHPATVVEEEGQIHRRQANNFAPAPTSPTYRRRKERRQPLEIGNITPTAMSKQRADEAIGAAEENIAAVRKRLKRPYSTHHQPHQTGATERRHDPTPMDQPGEKREPTPPPLAVEAADGGGWRLPSQRHPKGRRNC